MARIIMARIIMACVPPLACVALLAATGCQQSDPYVRQGLWRPTGANDANLRAMIADPADLRLGRGALASSGDMAAAAVARLRGDATKPLSDSSISSVHVSGAGAATGAPAGAATGADPVAAGDAGAGAAAGGS